MPHTVDAVFQDELRRAGLPGRGAPAHLLALLRESPETHLSLPEIAELAAEAGLAVTTSELVYDTVPEPHSHIVYEGSGQVVDLHVSSETLLLMVQDALARRPEGVEVILRFRRPDPLSS
jgi:Fur family iron response transcriptional regulator